MLVHDRGQSREIPGRHVVRSCPQERRSAGFRYPLPLRRTTATEYPKVQRVAEETSQPTEVDTRRSEETEGQGTQVSARAVADRVYRLMMQQMIVERERRSGLR